MTKALFLNISGRLEYTSINNSWALLPRIALNYNIKGFNISGVWGLYQQSPDNSKLMYVNRLPTEKTTQSLLSLYYEKNKRLFRVELYNKDYKKLSYFNDKGEILSRGRGYSYGVDLYLHDFELSNNFQYSVSYSYNYTKRNYDHYAFKVIPDYITKHNVTLSLKYTNYKIRSIIGITNRFASGRPVYDPNTNLSKSYFTPYYNSLDISYTFLAHSKLIIYASLTNVFNRNNIYGYEYNTNKNELGHYDRAAIKPMGKQTFYIGFFITLGKNVAYDVSNF